MNTKFNNHEKILFRLQKDEDGYPPDDWESLWAQKLENGYYRIDNVPFYVRGISCGDIVSVTKKKGEYYFNAVEEFSSNSVLRVLVYDSDQMSDKIAELKKSMTEFGCEYEGSHIDGLITFDIPSNVNWDDILKYLQSGEENNVWTYEEASLRN